MVQVRERAETVNDGRWATEAGSELEVVEAVWVKLEVTRCGSRDGAGG